MAEYASSSFLRAMKLVVEEDDERNNLGGVMAMDVRSAVFENAARLRALHHEIKRAFREAPHGPAHTAACAAFHASYDALAFPGGLDQAMRRLKRLEPQAVEAAIQFLEAGPWFFRSGYITEEIVRRLKQAPLTERQRNRLASVIVRSLSTGILTIPM